MGNVGFQAGIPEEEKVHQSTVLRTKSEVMQEFRKIPTSRYNFLL